MTRLIDADKIEYTSIAHLAPYDVAPSPCDTVMRAEINAMPTVDAIPIQYILTTIREWNRYGYAESAEALEILVMNWDKENSECVERKEE